MSKIQISFFLSLLSIIIVVLIVIFMQETPKKVQKTDTNISYTVNTNDLEEFEQGHINSH